MKADITITTEDWLCGHANSCLDCPAALALNRFYAPYAAVEVHVNDIRVWPTRGGFATRIAPPTELRRLIHALDNHVLIDTAPFTFSIEV